ncbi:MAG: DUF4254 domain-containing protein [Variovorax sp.]|nr:MAG: DUF4254 domain-containing protein [Variovorax sp.]
MTAHITGAAIVQLHDQLLAQPDWPGATAPEDGDGAKPWRWVYVNHFHNASLWAEEDLARRTRVSDGDIAANKRAIDRHNQARNDAVERIDELLLVALGLVSVDSARSDAPMTQPGAGARLSSETAGAMIDRLSILALKSRAMREQTARSDVEASHIAICRARLARLEEQRADLAACLDRLLAESREGHAWFKVYRQFKMYNDPAFNPALVAERRS